MGSFPFQINWSDVIKVGKDVLLVAVIAAITYLLDTVVPGIKPENAFTLAILPVVTAVLSSALKYFTDTRSHAEKLRLPYSEFKKLPAEEKRREKLSLKLK